MFENTRNFSSWGAEPYNWLDSASVDFEKNFIKNLDLLLNTNPILKESKPARSGCGDSRSMRRRVRESVIQNSEEILSGCDTNEEIQQRLEKFITNYLAVSHYLFLLNCAPRGAVSIREKQFYFPASYCVCGFVLQDAARIRQAYFINEQFCHDEFYERGNGGRRHPAIVIERLPNGRFLMTPYTNRDGDGKLAMTVNVDGSDERQFAIYKFTFEVSEAMLDEPKAIDRKAMKISDEDFDSLIDKIKEYDKSKYGKGA